MKSAHRPLRYLIPILIGTSIVFFWEWGRKQTENEIATSPRDFPTICNEGVIRAVTEYNTIGFFAVDDTIAGFHHDLLQAFARDHGLQVEFTPIMDFQQRFEGLYNGTYDIIASSLPLSNELKDTISFTHPILLGKQVLVQRKATHDSLQINSLLQLAGKTVYVPKHSPNIFRIRNLSEEIGDSIYLKEIEKYGSEQLISLVAHGEIDFAICDEQLALAAADSLPQLAIHLPVSFTLFYSWGINKQSPILLNTLNLWIDKFKQSKEYRRIYQKYF